MALYSTTATHRKKRQVNTESTITDFRVLLPAERPPRRDGLHRERDD
jgi:hypothetical protein